MIGRAPLPQERIGIAVSGGADSMALLAAAHHSWPGQIEAATVDHGLRPKARQEAEMVAAWCATADIPHAILTPEAPIAGNLQASARIARYRLLDAWREARGLAWLMTAHQADDQIETVILRLNRGSGVGGLASVRGRREHLLRPLLGERRATLRAYCVANDLPFVDDPSNIDPRFDRARLRALLAEGDLIAPAGLARSVEALEQADAALAWMADSLADDYLDLGDRAAVLNRTDLPSEILRRLLLKMIEYLNPEAEKPRGPSLDQALVQLLDAKTVTLADCVITGGGTWASRRAPPRKSR
nr:tRNA lysidine(34) synthetase TilS [Sphingobium nicotianae]